jgi:hypothetical protein
MIEYQCLACETVAYTSATGGSSHGCPSCGAPLEEVGMADEPRPAAEVAPLLPDLLLPDFEEFPMDSSVQAVRSAEGLREQAPEKR